MRLGAGDLTIPQLDPVPLMVLIISPIRQSILMLECVKKVTTWGTIVCTMSSREALACPIFIRLPCMGDRSPSLPLIIVSLTSLLRGVGLPKMFFCMVLVFYFASTGIVAASNEPRQATLTVTCTSVSYFHFSTPLLGLNMRGTAQIAASKTAAPSSSPCLLTQDPMCCSSIAPVCSLHVHETSDRLPSLQVNSGRGAVLLGLLGVAQTPATSMVGISCSALAAGGSCTMQTACCQPGTPDFSVRLVTNAFLALVFIQLTARSSQGIVAFCCVPGVL